MQAIFISDKLLNVTFCKKIKLFLETLTLPLTGGNILPHKTH